MSRCYFNLYLAVAFVSIQKQFEKLIIIEFQKVITEVCKVLLFLKTFSFKSICMCSRENKPTGTVSVFVAIYEYCFFLEILIVTTNVYLQCINSSCIMTYLHSYSNSNTKMQFSFICLHLLLKL